jgi:hypothetical protein
MTSPSNTLRRQALSAAGADAGRAAAPSPRAAAQASQGLKPIGLTFGNLAAQFRAKAGE